MPANEVVSQFSEFLKAAEIPHKITELLLEVEFDQAMCKLQMAEKYISSKESCSQLMLIAAELTSIHREVL